jgi:hypothetical protein
MLVATVDDLGLNALAHVGNRAVGLHRCRYIVAGHIGVDTADTATEPVVSVELRTRALGQHALAGRNGFVLTPSGSTIEPGIRKSSHIKTRNITSRRLHSLPNFGVALLFGAGQLLKMILFYPMSFSLT